MLTYKHFVWDFDGMLFDSYPHTTRAVLRALADGGRTADPEEMYWDLRVSIGYMRRKYRLTDLENQAFYKYERELDEEPITVPYKGIPELLSRIKAAGGHNYLLTNRDEYAGIYLEKYGMAESFTEVVDTTYGFPAKPDPSGMQYLQTKYGFDGDALMLGDRELDIIAGIGGGGDGCFFDEFHRVTETQAKYIVHSIEELETLIFGNEREGEDSD
ncbi:MAG: HAD hydrolase-like protein [Clostridia bacterium]|nr:HAD hydrolase-like protein [Clostridia bacterium]